MKKKTVTYQGREYRLVKGAHAACPLSLGVEARHNSPPKAAPFCGPIGAILRETLGSRLAHWGREWVKRNIVDDDPYENETHSAARYSTLDEVNARRGYPTEEPKEGHDDN